MWSVYILECADRSLYTGSTTNIERRLVQHQQGKGAKYTRGRRPVLCRFIRQYSTRAEAQRVEAGVKKLARIHKLQLVHDTPLGVDILRMIERRS